MKVENLKLEINTDKFFDIVDLTDQVQNFLDKVSAGNGTVNVFTKHTTIAIKINEKEDGFFHDLKEVIFSELAKVSRDYKHNDIENRDPVTLCPNTGGEECLNGHSHIAQMLLGSASETIAVENGKMLLGTWQRILMFELDRAKTRHLVLTFIGTSK